MQKLMGAQVGRSGMLNVPRALAVLLVIAPLMLFGSGIALAETDETTGSSFPNAALNEQVIRVPGEDPPAVTLQVTIFHPNGSGPFPLAIMDHGATNVSAGNRGTRYRLTNAAFYFLSRGYAVALPMMRGFAASGGEAYHFGCDLTAVGIANAKDIRAVIRSLGADGRFDTRRVIVAGQSFGGWNTLAVGSLNIPNVKALINFNGGIRASDCKAGDSSLINGAGQFGAQTRTPTIWFYGENDELFSVGLWQAMHDRYVRAGGRAELVDVGVVLKNSHNFLAYPESQALWVSRLDNFLNHIGMPSTKVYDGYLPMAFPPATQFASITDLAAVPLVTDKAKAVYRKFLMSSSPRVFVIAENGGVVSMSEGWDPLGRALETCHKAGVKCNTYAVDDQVVWIPPKAAEHSYNVTAKADQATLIDFSYRLNPDCSPKTFAKFKVVEQPKHGEVDIARRTGLPNFAATSPFAICNKTPVQGVAVVYKPAAGFSGNDFFAFADDGTAGPSREFRISLSVK